MAADDWFLFKLKIIESEIQMPEVKAIKVPVWEQQLMVKSFHRKFFFFFLLHTILWTPCAIYKG